jgi:hypothetical protein
VTLYSVVGGYYIWPTSSEMQAVIMCEMLCTHLPDYMVSLSRRQHDGYFKFVTAV